MNRIGAGFAALMLIALAACGNKQEAPPAEQTAPAQTAAPAASEPAAATPGDEAAAPAAESPATPSETISETDDGGQETTAEAAPSTTQPSLRLGGPSNASPTSAQFKEGANYSKVVPNQPTSVGPGRVEVVEVFWYGCGHCFALDPSIESWRSKSKPSYVEFVRIPAMWNETTRMHARMFYTAELLGKLEELHAPMFREINVKGNQLNTVDKITAFFRQNGVNADDFQKAFSSFAVESKLQRADFLNRRYRIESVPTVIVNGKYRTDIGMAGGEEQLFGLIGELSASEHGG
ncbi:thiol:disulfide interchange protein DsbA [Povalibacter uvarum]|uniref:Thiol:disulfide interchange protein DsbA n=1 Tax=Povalibacter uvarum TaxID=732238 RepID=A0A841HIT1_9GAMM|nr:thiol:disulfide interchange protein DsbA/DsbL [Povalibacter uvarum]MBB6092716.1 thiol:disulfide interchange protein DsbA [Povalibacter uvarum]